MTVFYSTGSPETQKSFCCQKAQIFQGLSWVYRSAKIWTLKGLFVNLNKFVSCHSQSAVAICIFVSPEILMKLLTRT